MAILDDLAASLPQSSSSSSASFSTRNELSGLLGSSSSIANAHISNQMSVFAESYPDLEPRFIHPDPKPLSFDAFFMPETNIDIGRGGGAGAGGGGGAGAEGFVSGLPHALGDSGAQWFAAAAASVSVSASGSSSSSSSLAEPSGWSVEQICGVVAVAVIVPFILASNLLVIVSVARFKRLQMPTNYFIVSLAAVDIFVALVTPFVIVVEVLPGQVCSGSFFGFLCFVCAVVA